jgi:hypothetical protein
VLDELAFVKPRPSSIYKTIPDFHLRPHKYCLSLPVDDYKKYHTGQKDCRKTMGTPSGTDESYARNP